MIKKYLNIEDGSELTLSDVSYAYLTFDMKNKLKCYEQQEEPKPKGWVDTGKVKGKR